MVDNIFGTDGIRATVGIKPFTPTLLHELGKSIALWALKKYAKPKLLLGHDTRISCDLVKSSLKSGLLLYPLTVYDGATLTSPAVCKIITVREEFDCGIIISASHNPFQDNGIKIIDKHQGKLTLEDELEISFLFQQNIKGYSYNHLGTDIIWHEAEQIYLELLKKIFKTNFLIGKKIVLDCANGASYRLAPLLFSYFGASVIVINSNPNGININDQCGALYPENLQKTVIENQADAGFAFDGDADRVIMVNNQGLIKDGDDILALLLGHPNYSSSNRIVGTIMTNQGLEYFLEKRDKKLIRTSVGDKYITASLLENNLSLGGEPSGHIIARDYLLTGDGIFTALRVLETMIMTKNWTMETFTKFPQIIINVPISFKRDLTITPFAQLINQSQRALIQGRLIVRYSGTEHLLRIMIEDNDYNHAYCIGNKLAQQLSQVLN